MTVFSTKIIEGERASLEVEAADLEVITGPDRGVKITLGTDNVLIGSGPDCELVLHDPTISARHAEIFLTPQGYTIRDLESTNGIFCGNVAIFRAPLTDGMKLRLGATTLRVRARGERRSFSLWPAGSFGGLVAHAPKMRAFVASLAQAAGTASTVLIEGETGTGKELAAQALHEASRRARGPFVVLDCGAIPPSLLAAELFGVEQGAFTSAETNRPGLLEEADGGTLFLDEIGELPLELQPMLLGVIERRSSRRVGGQSERQHDVRIVAATHRNLAEAVRAKHFREDLYYRLAVIRLRIPPLRERAEDQPLLIDQLSAEAGVQVSPEVLALLTAHDWPGNVRELRNTIARLGIDPEAVRTLRPERPRSEPGLYDEHGRLRPLSIARQEMTAAFERRYLEEVFTLAKGVMARAAEIAGVSRQFLSVLSTKHGIRVKRSE